MISQGKVSTSRALAAATFTGGRSLTGRGRYSSPDPWSHSESSAETALSPPLLPGWSDPSNSAISSEIVPRPTPSPGPYLHAKGPVCCRTGGQIGRYRLLERIGRGRQADVWRALQTDPFVEEVALKILNSTAGDHRRRAQLRREAERGARLNDPSLLRTYEYGEAEGTVYMAMPLIEGCTLATIIGQRKSYEEGQPYANSHRLATISDAVYLSEVVGIMAKVARAAAGAHSAGIAHRDIKPGNILLRTNHREGVFLCDIGLGRDLDVATPAQLRDGAGSPLYMAPERLLRRPADEIRGDVYALGVTLFEALTLGPPLVVPPELERSLWALYLTTTTPRKPSELFPTIPTRLENVILRATARDPLKRYATASHLAEELERIFDGAGTTERRCLSRA